MRRGTTPTLTFTIPKGLGTITKLSIVLKGNNDKMVEKSLNDVQITDNIITTTLTELDTLSFENEPKQIVLIQLRFEANSKKYASEVYSTVLEGTLKNVAL